MRKAVRISTQQSAKTKGAVFRSASNFLRYLGVSKVLGFSFDFSDQC
jgi:hypothetical protein